MIVLGDELEIDGAHGAVAVFDFQPHIGEHEAVVLQVQPLRLRPRPDARLRRTPRRDARRAAPETRRPSARRPGRRAECDRPPGRAPSPTARTIRNRLASCQISAGLDPAAVVDLSVDRARDRDDDRAAPCPSRVTLTHVRDVRHRGDASPCARRSGPVLEGAQIVAEPTGVAGVVLEIVGEHGPEPRRALQQVHFRATKVITRASSRTGSRSRPDGQRQTRVRASPRSRRASEAGPGLAVA